MENLAIADARTTQLYIHLNDNPQLDGQGFVPIARVAEGMDAVEKLYGSYGEHAVGGMRGGRQAPIFEGRNAYLDRGFPKLDKLLRVPL